MANLKFRFSKQRTRTKRSSIKAEAPTFMICPNCGTPVRYHNVCGECGYYKGKPVIEKTA